jgi:hypothetical protein
VEGQVIQLETLRKQLRLVNVLKRPLRYLRVRCQIRKMVPNPRSFFQGSLVIS